MNLLRELYVTGKIKELLAQGIKNELRYKNNKTPEEKQQEIEQTLRLVPWHTYIDQDLLESVHLGSSLFFEAKAILKSKGDDVYVENKSFRRQWDKRQNRDFLAPPENTKDTILEACSTMQKGDWEKCEDLLNSLRFWNEFDDYASTIKETFFKQAKSECLCCYLISSSNHFTDIRLHHLVEKFKLPKQTIIQLCSKFISANDFRGSINLPGEFLVIHEQLPTIFETAAIQYHEKLVMFMAAMEDLHDPKQKAQRDRQRKEGGNNQGGNRTQQSSNQ
eukprot:UN32280